MKKNVVTPKVSEDRGCRYAPRCVSCPFKKCIKELDAATRAEFADAWRIVVSHLAPTHP